MYKYFAPDEPDGDGIGPPSNRGSSVRSSVHSRGDIVPLYDEEGKFYLMFTAILPTTYSGTIGEITGYMLKPKKQLDAAPVTQLPSSGTSISDFITSIFISISVMKNYLHNPLSLQLRHLFHLRRKLWILTGMDGRMEHFPEILHLKKSTLTTISKYTGLQNRMGFGEGKTLQKNG